MVVNTETLRFEIEKISSIAKENKVFTELSFCAGFLDDETGRFDFESPVENLNRVFDLSSITKALVTTPLVLNKVYSALKTEEATLEEVFINVDFQSLEAAKTLKICDVLRHEAGLPFWKNFYVKNPEGETRPVKVVLSESLKEINLGPKKNVYSDVGMLLLGFLLQLSEKQSIEAQWGRFCREILSLDVNYLPKPSWNYDVNQCVPTGFCNVRNRNLQGEVHDENAWSLGGFTTHSGLFGSMMEVKTYLRALYQSRMGKKILDANYSWAKKFNQSDSALGWRTGRDYSSKPFGNGDSIGHMGFTGTAFWVNPTNRSFAVLLTNRVACDRIKNLPLIKEFRKEVFGLLQNYISQQENFF